MVGDNHKQQSGAIIGCSGFLRYAIRGAAPVEHVYRGFLLTDSSNRSGATIANLYEMMVKLRNQLKSSN